MEKELILKCEKISKSFGPTRALDNVDLNLYRGEVRGLIGENGSGKSTLSSIIAGAQFKDSGRIIYSDEEFIPTTVVDAQIKGISQIVQEMGTLPGLSVAFNIFVGNLEKFTKHGIIDIKAINRSANEILRSIGAEDISAEEKIDKLNFEERKIVEIARAMFINPELLIIDETTTALAQKGRSILFRIIKKMQQDNKTVLFISHDLDEILNTCTGVTILRDGVLIDTLKKEQMSVKAMRKLMVGRELKGDYYRADYGSPLNSDNVLEMRHVSLGNAIRNVNLKLAEGEILGIGGLANSGMHEVGMVLAGLKKPVTGEIVLSKKNIRIRRAKQSVREGMGYVSKNRDTEALVQEASIKDNITTASYKKISKLGIITKRSEHKLAKELIDFLNIKCISDAQFCSELSGGNKQKVALAKWIANDSKILILDCPTRGIDIGVKAAIYKLINNLRQEGVSIVLISEELIELIGMCDRILVFKNGEISVELMRSELLTEQEIVKFMI